MVLVGCGIEEPTSSFLLDGAPSDSVGRSQVAAIPAFDVSRYSASKPVDSPIELVDRYATLRTNIAPDTDADHIIATASMSTKTHAVDVDRQMRDAPSRSHSDGSIDAGQVVGTSSERAGDSLAVYAIVRIGRYDADGGLIGDTRIVVYAVGLKKVRGGYLVDSWQEAR